MVYELYKVYEIYKVTELYELHKLYELYKEGTQPGRSRDTAGMQPGRSGGGFESVFAMEGQSLVVVRVRAHGNSEFGIANSEFGIPNSEFGIRGPNAKHD